MNIINSRFGVNASTQRQPRSLDKTVNINKSTEDEFKSLVKKGTPSSLNGVATLNNLRVDKIEISHKVDPTTSTF